MDVPFFIPTSKGEVSAIASLPEEGEVQGTAVVLLPGDANARTRVRVLRDAAPRIASSGRPVLRFDYPGAGLSPGTRGLPLEELTTVTIEVSDWFLAALDLSDVALGGTCYGGRVALKAAGRQSPVSHVVAVGCPLRHTRHRRAKPRVRAGIAGLDSIGPRVTTHLARVGRPRKTDAPWQTGLIEDLVAATRASLEFVYGAEDRNYQDFLELKESVLPKDVADSIQVSLLKDTSINHLLDVEQHPEVVSLLVRALSSNASQSTADV